MLLGISVSAQRTQVALARAGLFAQPDARALELRALVVRRQDAVQHAARVQARLAVGEQGQLTLKFHVKHLLIAT